MATALQLAIDLVAKDRMSAPVKAATGAVDKLGAEAAQTERKVESLGAAFDRLRPKGETIGVAFQGVGVAVGALGGIFAAAAANSDALSGRLGAVARSGKDAFGALGDAIAKSEEMNRALATVQTMFETLGKAARRDQRFIDDLVKTALDPLAESAIVATRMVSGLVQTLQIFSELAGPWLQGAKGALQSSPPGVMAAGGTGNPISDLRAMAAAFTEGRRDVAEGLQGVWQTVSGQNDKLMIRLAKIQTNEEDITRMLQLLRDGRASSALTGDFGGDAFVGPPEPSRPVPRTASAAARAAMGDFDRGGFVGPVQTDAFDVSEALASQFSFDEAARQSADRDRAEETARRQSEMQARADADAKMAAQMQEAQNYQVASIMVASDALYMLATTTEVTAAGIGQMVAGIGGGIGSIVGMANPIAGAVISGLAPLAGALIERVGSDDKRSQRRRANLAASSWTPRPDAGMAGRAIVIYQTINGTYVRESEAAGEAMRAASRWTRTQGRA